MTEPEKSFHESFHEDTKVSISDGGNFQPTNMETNAQNPQKTTVKKVSMGGNNGEKFPGQETNCFQVVSIKVSSCPGCGAVVNPLWKQCLSCGHEWSENPPAKVSAPDAADVQFEFEERAAIVEFDGEIPTEWAEGLARLCAMPKPSNVSARRWRLAVDAAGRFCDQWAAKAAALGWSTLDIFGVDRLKPVDALYTAGLIWILQGKVIVAISDDAVIVETVSGIRQSYRPRQDTDDSSRRVLLWELDGS